MITKELTKDNELYLYMNGHLIYKKWLNTGQSKIFDVMAYDKYTYSSFTDLDIKDSPYLIHVVAKIRLKTSKEGGHTNGIISGYRPNHVFEYADNGLPQNMFMGDIRFDEQELLEPGNEYIVTIRFPISQRIEMYLDKGRKWWIHEGPRNIGEAEIIDFKMPS